MKYRMPLALAVMIGIVAVRTISASHLPLRQFTTADGLANNAINHIVTDPRGFMWFATSEGVSRFDGYSFSNLTTRDGLPSRSVDRLLITRSGTFWMATPRGLVRFYPERPLNDPDRIVVLLPPGRPNSKLVNYIIEDHAGRIWCGTAEGVFVLDPAAAKLELLPIDFEIPGKVYGDSNVSALAEDREGAIWAAMLDGSLRRRLADGRVEHYTTADGIPTPAIGSAPEMTDMLVDRSGRLWVGSTYGLFRVVRHPHHGMNIVEYEPGPREGFPRQRVYCFYESSKGDVWVGMFRYFAHFPQGEGPIQVLNQREGLPELGVLSIGEDRNQNLWLGTSDTGVVKLSSHGFTSYSHEDGLQGTSIPTISETRHGELFTASRTADAGVVINVFREGGFQSVVPLSPGITGFGWQPTQFVLQDHAGEWWVGSSQGLLRYPSVDDPVMLGRIPPKAVYTSRDGLNDNHAICVFEDTQGNIWTGLDGPGITVWRRKDERFHWLAKAMDRPIAITEDRLGNIWVGDWGAHVWRIHGDSVELIAAKDEFGLIHDLLIDHAGRLWAATGNGLLRFDHPDDPKPTLKRYDLENGLSSATLYRLVEDENGFIYLATGNAVDRLDPESGHVKHFTTAEGVAPGKLFSAYRDRHGDLWFGTTLGLARLNAEPPTHELAPATWITGVSVGGRELPISYLGLSEVRDIEIPAGQEQIQFSFVALSYASGDVPQYQYRIGDGPWSQPIQSRTLNYGGLGPGQYRFSVRATNADGDVSPSPAVVQFRVLPPFWQRPWFYVLLIAVISGLAFMAHRMRVNKLLQLERIRLGIATDLHDDIGASLSRIAILSEVAQRGSGPHDLGDVLQRIGGLAREVLDSTSDIVWAVHPQKDRLSDLQRRMRHFSADVLTARNISMAWKAADSSSDTELGAHLRRHVYLIFKESINNISRHSGATEVSIELARTRNELVLKIRDNGRGFDTSVESMGNGVKSIRNRAAQLRAHLDLQSVPGDGTYLSLRVPLHE